MNYYRAAEQRGHANFGWLDSHHSFSFGSYYDPKHMGVSALRVVNDDTVAEGAGFGTHGHRDMEIISYVLEGSIAHVDSMGHRYTVPAGEVQRMSAGSGVTHSEFNASTTEKLRFLQIWVQPNVKGIKPEYEQAHIPQSKTLTPLVTPDGCDGSLMMHQDASIYRLRLEQNESARLSLNKGRVGYLHVVSGSAQLDDQLLVAGDGLGVYEKTQFDALAKSDNFEALWFDLPPEEKN
ncbi:pirin family protein [Zhongshania sp. BJYM1]|uniref:pirin family protein n=1 Tax=Zhongshania aquatica TaxID=2965069 RepID=UPI0022B51BC7|nr:pirin family protein [Marortus sp. BJYM1]